MRRCRNCAQRWVICTFCASGTQVLLASGVPAMLHTMQPYRAGDAGLGVPKAQYVQVLPMLNQLSGFEQDAYVCELGEKLDRLLVDLENKVECENLDNTDEDSVSPK